MKSFLLTKLITVWNDAIRVSNLWIKEKYAFKSFNWSEKSPQLYDHIKWITRTRKSGELILPQLLWYSDLIISQQASDYTNEKHLGFQKTDWTNQNLYLLYKLVFQISKQAE